MSYTKKPDSDELGTHSRRASYEDQSAANNSVRFFDRKVKQKQFYIERTARNCRGWIFVFGIFVIYSPPDVPEIVKFMECWNHLSQDNGLKGIFFVGLYWGKEIDVVKWEQYNLDAISICNVRDAEVSVKGRYKRALYGKIRKVFLHII